MAKTLAFYRAHSGSISVSTNNSKLIILHLLARAYFVENYVSDDTLRKKFNTRMLALLFQHGRKSVTGIRSIQDFYFAKDKADIDYTFLAKLIFEILKK